MENTTEDKTSLVSPMPSLIIGLLILFLVKEFLIDNAFIDLTMILFGLVLASWVIRDAVVKKEIVMWGGWKLEKEEQRTAFRVTLLGYTVISVILVLLIFMILSRIVGL